MSAIDSLSFHADGKFDLERFRDTRAILDLRTSKAALIQPRLLRRAASILRRKTNRKACFISPSAERLIVRRFDTRGKTRAGFRAPPAQRREASGIQRALGELCSVPANTSTMLIVL